MYDLNELKERFIDVIDYTQGLDEICVDDLFDNWERGKKRFIDKWGGLTLETDEVLTFTKDFDEKEKNKKDFVIDISYFVGCFSLDKEIGPFLKSISVDAFYSNKTDVDWVHPENPKIRIAKGAKLSKALKNFFDKNDSTAMVYLEKFQNRLSRMIQEEKITGKLVLSVHPLDFLSSSENAHNWHSCHALDGEYRAGNLSYMSDEVTFMAYLKSEEDCELLRFPFKWNSKKWRVIMHLNKDETILAKGREYPFSSSEIMGYLIDNLLSKINKNLSGQFEPASSIIDLVMYDARGSLHYNDCLNSPSYHPEIMIPENMDFNTMSFAEIKHMVIGKEVLCLSCGKMPIGISSGVVCDECGGYEYCDHCGELMVDEDEIFYTSDGEHLCADCFYYSRHECDSCGCECEDDDIFYDENTGRYLCSDCLGAYEGD